MVQFRQIMNRQVKIVVEKHSDGFVAYPLGLKGVVVGEGDSYEEALADVKSAIRFHIETFGSEVLPDDGQISCRCAVRAGRVAQTALPCPTIQSTD